LSNLQVFNNKEFGQVRVLEKDGQPWFIAKDVCECLEIKNSRDAVSRLDEDEKDVVLTDTPGGNQKLQVVNEYGLYTLILSSRKPEAKKFKRWITHEVIPSIRKHGAYMTPEKIEEVLMNPDTIIQLATALKKEQQRRLQAEKQIEEQRPKVLFADAVSTAKNSILVGELAKLLKQNGIDIGQNRLFQWLRDNGYLIKRKGTDYNMPTQYAMELGLFEVKETTITHADGHISISKTPKVTGKGQMYFINKFIEGQAESEIACN
jgi:anti-repressor protein